MSIATDFLRASLLIFTFSTSVVGVFENLADVAGFIYEPNEDIYVTQIDALQRGFGYSSLFDFFSPLGKMVIDTEPVIFSHAGRTFMIELWKGQYFASIGCEIGIYEWNGIMWTSVKNEDMLFISYTLRRDGKKLFDRAEYHWWIAGFLPGVFAEPEDLAMDDIFIEFKSVPMRDAFLSSLYRLGYDDDDEIIAPPMSTFIIFDYTEPKTEQYWSKAWRKYYQKENRLATKMFKNRKEAIGGTDNSPKTIDAMFW